MSGTSEIGRSRLGLCTVIFDSDEKFVKMLYAPMKVQGQDDLVWAATLMNQRTREKLHHEYYEND